MARSCLNGNAESPQRLCCADEPRCVLAGSREGAGGAAEFCGTPPAMCQEAPADVTRAVAAWSGAGHALRLARLPRELDAVQVAVLLPLGS